MTVTPALPDQSEEVGSAAPSTPLPRWLPLPGVAVTLVALVGWWVWRETHPVGLKMMLDLGVYRDGGAALRHGSGLYQGRYTGAQLPFTYPPFAAMVFTAATLVSFAHAQVLMAAMTVVGVFAVAWLCWGRLGYPASAGRVGAALLVGAVGMWTEPVQQTLYFGQVNVLLMLVVVADLCLADGNRLKGVGVGLAAGFKLVPGIFILYLLLTRRFRAAAVSVGVLVATVGIAYALFPTESGQYWGGLFLDSNRVGPIGYLGDQSLHGLVYRALHGGPDVQAVWAVLAALVAALGLWVATRQHRAGRELLGVLATAVTGLLVSPISWSHHWVWVVPALVLLADVALRRRSGLLRAAPAAVALFFAAWPRDISGLGVLPSGAIWFLPNHHHLEYGWSAAQTALGESYSVLGLGLLAGLSLAPLRGRYRSSR
ncbi:glycosyltransferase 87 family protein [Streptacidiphilus jiangxiensis]|uniref:Alpha-1,2-mannosyltransferase n=1 Tax=Streptacidiphilus jiangxiensis TaxID=235985 RepID=A0A1H7GGT8_STRJI|nr:glycosyltransferase 87 family protein [Streptacidiphilus jiangxiensis]SEK36142.1 alpha-1,2-mannosyltransferase [Streptacidiphilus jiangxiensis]